ncbi:MAG: restriction endonuclease subunit M [Bacteroidales bacterium]|nr:restriction endonuclease subunit M [Bacteroidales bacterium]MCM1205063.1 restriction endonuclease subunit M [Bacillota bacterium]MCM1511396.1 restriction endonuclease subunit M [Clostridium sp.]
MPFEADILEDAVFRLSPALLDTLLKDHTMSTKDVRHNIFWATSDYEHLGHGYQYDSPILPHLITGDNGHVIMPRVLKNRNTQTARSRNMAEVFTPSWICNAQNNLIDEAWFGRRDVFNKEYTDGRGCHRWQPNAEKILFPDGKTWKDYVHDIRLEITCGEAPYIVSRYDTTTGEAIPIEQRIGLLDRKLRVVGENTATSGEWLEWAQEAYKSIYAYEWQGDNLLIARESMLISFIEYYRQKFGKCPLLKSINYIAYIISWNVWQMDGLKGVVPNSCGEHHEVVADLFGTREEISQCKGCLINDIRRHNGVYCQIKDWHATDKATGKKGKRIRFIDLIK